MIFHDEFFPTPFQVAIGMAAPYLSRPGIVSILDPSAGKGDLLKPFRDRQFSRYAFEQSPELCAILRNEKIQVLGYDWFSYRGGYLFDLVLMNPPFSNGVDHLLHAREVCDGAAIVCLLPAETIRNPHTRKQELLVEAILEHGHTEDMGRCFAKAERPTDVEICKVTFPGRAKEKTWCFGFDPEEEDEPSVDPADLISQEQGLVKRDRVASLEAQYKSAIEAFKEETIARGKMYKAIGTLISHENTAELVHQSLNYIGSGNVMNTFIDGLKRACWNSLFKEGKFAQYMTSSVQKDFAKFSEENGQLAFTAENITMVFESLLGSRRDIIQKNIEVCFDALTAYHKENRIHIEGWKTNDRWKIRNKFILPYILDQYTPSKPWWSYSYSKGSTLRDLDIALCSLTGKDFEKIVTTEHAISQGCSASRDKNYWETQRSEFFEIECFKKGTGHFTFLDEDLWNQFNRAACEAKRWLPQ